MAPGNDPRVLAHIVEFAEDAIFSWDGSETIVSWNQAAERFFGHSQSEVIGQPLDLIIPAEVRRHDEETVMRALPTGRHHFDTVRRHRDGRLMEVSVTRSTAAEANGRPGGGSEIIREVTGRRRLEAAARHLGAIIDSSDDAIVSKDLTGVVQTWNASAERIFGFSAEEMIGQSIRRIIPADRMQEEDEVLAKIRGGDRVDHYETVRQRKDGSRVAVSLTVSPIRNQWGEVIGASKIARDITDRERAEHERQRLLAIARDASQLKDEFLATLSHELRTPLNAIVGYVRMMQAGLLTGDKQTRAMDTVARNAASLTQIVEDVLDVSRIISGKLRLDVQAVDFPALIETAIETVRPAADAKGIRLDVILDPRATPVSGDMERLQQVLWNLLSNAVKFTDRRGRVTVQLERLESHVELTVADTGIGISPEFLPHLFERFRQEDAGMGRVRGGLGLGLAIARHLVELQGGVLSATSPGLGKGATFRVDLPIRAARTASALEPDLTSRSPRQAAELLVPPLQGVRVLAVDDDRDTLALIREILEATGATVSTADSGEHALEALRRSNHEVLVADLGMPNMTGFDLIELVRRSDQPKIRSIPAAALTAYARSEDRSRALRSGFQIHLSKPVDPAELMAAVASLARGV